MDKEAQLYQEEKNKHLTIIIESLHGAVKKLNADERRSTTLSHGLAKTLSQSANLLEQKGWDALGPILNELTKDERYLEIPAAREFVEALQGIHRAISEYDAHFNE